MAAPPVGSDAGILGREEELAALQAFFSVRPFAGTLVLSGGPGIGKTTLWEAGVGLARERGMRVLVARASEAETQLAFAALIDLLDGVDLGEVRELPPPQLRALEVALLRKEAAGVPPAPQAASFGFLGALRAMAACGPIVVALDDMQWLDSPSAETLAFAARRLTDERVGFLLAKRADGASALERELGKQALQTIDVGPLSLGAVRRLLADRLGLRLPRHVLRRLVDSTVGNPLFAIEIGRVLAERGPLDTGEDIPVPETVEDLLGTRVARLPAPIRRLLLAVALSADLRTSQVASMAGMAALDDAVELGVLLVDGDRLRPSHPLFAAAAKRHSRATERRDVHLELAGVIADVELRALHLALATEVPDSGLSATVAAAAAGASARGARLEAAELAEHALRLTPPGAPEYDDRLLSFADYLDLTGAKQRVTDLVTHALATLQPGAMRGRAWLILSEGGGFEGLGERQRHLEAALAESRGDPVLRAYALAKKSDQATVLAVSQIREAEAWAQEALDSLETAAQASPNAERRALGALAWARALRGRPIDDLCKRFQDVSSTASILADSPERVAAQRLAWRVRSAKHGPRSCKCSSWPMNKAS